MFEFSAVCRCEVVKIRILVWERRSGCVRSCRN